MISLIFSNLLVWGEIFSLNNEFSIIFLDVGQGDSILAKVGVAGQILIDGGPDGEKILEKLHKYTPFWDNTIEVIILTHSDYDHLNGLNYVLRGYKVKNIIWTGAEKKSRTFGYWEENIEKEKEEGAKVYFMKRGDTIRTKGAEFIALFPLISYKNKIVDKKANQTSLVFLLRAENKKFLLAGDITKKEEQTLLEFEELEADVLKVPHHGSRSSSGAKFLQAVSPQTAVISCGEENRYSHPHKEVLSLYKNLGIKVLRTDKEGDIIFD